MNKFYDFEVISDKGVRLVKHDKVELDNKSVYFYAMRLMQRYGIRPVEARWRESGAKEWKSTK